MTDETNEPEHLTQEIELPNDPRYDELDGNLAATELVTSAPPPSAQCPECRGGVANIRWAYGPAVAGYEGSPDTVTLPAVEHGECPHCGAELMRRVAEDSTPGAWEKRRVPLDES